MSINKQINAAGLRHRNSHGFNFFCFAVLLSSKSTGPLSTIPADSVCFLDEQWFHLAPASLEAKKELHSSPSVPLLRIYPSISRQHFEFLGDALPLRFIAFFAVINFGSIKHARKDSVERKPTPSNAHQKDPNIFLPRKVVKKLWAVPYLKSVTHVNLRVS